MSHTWTKEQLLRSKAIIQEGIKQHQDLARDLKVELHYLQHQIDEIDEKTD